MPTSATAVKIKVISEAQKSHKVKGQAGSVGAFMQYTTIDTNVVDKVLGLVYGKDHVRNISRRKLYKSKFRRKTWQSKVKRHFQGKSKVKSHFPS